MADQASVRPTIFSANPPMSGGPRPSATAPTGSGPNGQNGSVVGSIAEFGNDVATLVELQAKLAGLDFKESAVRATVPLVAITASALLSLAAVPVLLLGFADLIARALNVLPGVGMLITAVLAFALAGVVIAIFASKLAASTVPLRRSREEFTRNASWLRTVLVYSGRAYPKRGL